MSNPTSNFGWQMPTATDLVTDLPADFEVFGQAVDTALMDLKGGTTGQVLKKNTDANMDFVWATDASGMTNPMTTTGDTIYSSSGSTPARLGIGSTGQVLTVAGGVPTWASAGPTFSGVAVSNSAAISVPNTTFTALTFDTEQVDTDAYHSTSSNTSRITIPAGKTGTFLIIGAVTWNANATGDRYLSLRLNGNAIGSQLHMGTAAGKNFGIFETIYSLTAGDYIELFAYQASGGSLDVRCDDLATLTTRFQATYLGA
jgi:hypothetical protein